MTLIYEPCAPSYQIEQKLFPTMIHDLVYRSRTDLLIPNTNRLMTDLDNLNLSIGPGKIKKKYLKKIMKDICLTYKNLPLYMDINPNIKRMPTIVTYVIDKSKTEIICTFIHTARWDIDMVYEVVRQYGTMNIDTLRLYGSSGVIMYEEKRDPIAIDNYCGFEVRLKIYMKFLR